VPKNISHFVNMISQNTKERENPTPSRLLTDLKKKSKPKSYQYQRALFNEDFDTEPSAVSDV
jgi:hypothetical protein